MWRNQQGTNVFANKNITTESVTEKDFHILKQAMDFAIDVNKELFRNYDVYNNSDSKLVHTIAGPPYFENEPQMPNIMKTQR